jgi:hypothetical protein
MVNQVQEAAVRSCLESRRCDDLPARVLGGSDSNPPPARYLPATCPPSPW